MTPLHVSVAAGATCQHADRPIYHPPPSYAFMYPCPPVQMKVKMDDMAQEFGDMLKETLDRMRERIEASERLLATTGDHI